MRKSIMGALMVMLVLGLCLPVRAAEETGTIEVVLRSGDEPVGGGTVTLFRVGDRIPEGYRITDEFGGGIIRLEDAGSPHLAQWLAQTEGDSGMVRLLDADGSACFSDLTEGLYMLVQNDTRGDFFPILPFLLTLPMDEQWDIRVYPCTQLVLMENPHTGQHPAPILGAMGMVASGVGLALCAGKKRRE